MILADYFGAGRSGRRIDAHYVRARRRISSSVGRGFGNDSNQTSILDLGKASLIKFAWLLLSRIFLPFLVGRVVISKQERYQGLHSAGQFHVDLLLWEVWRLTVLEHGDRNKKSGKAAFFVPDKVPASAVRPLILNLKVQGGHLPDASGASV